MSAKKLDNTHRPLVALINDHGATFQSTAAVGNGAPDGFVGFLGVTMPCEFKSGPEKKPRVFADGRKRKGTRTEELQAAWRRRWKGSPCWLLRTPGDVLAMLNSMRDRARRLASQPRPRVDVGEP